MKNKMWEEIYASHIDSLKLTLEEFLKQSMSMNVFFCYESINNEEI